MDSLTDVSIAAPTIAQTLNVMLLQAGFNTALVVVGTTCLGIAAGTIGTFSLLRKRALVADALAHSALPGLGVAFLVGSYLGIGGKHLWLLLSGAALSGVLGVLCIQFISRHTRLHEDCAIGAVLSVFFGAGVVLMSLIQSLGTGEEGGLHHFIYGQTAAMNRHDAVLTLSCALSSIAICASALKEFRLVCFDREFARATGWPVSAIDLAMMALIVTITIIGLQSVGLLLIVSLLVIPPAAARFWTNRLNRMIVIAGVIGGMSGYAGSVASALFARIPAGAVIVLVAGLIFFVSMLIAPTRGLVFLTVTHLRMRVRFVEDHLLRSLYERTEQIGSTEDPFPYVPLSNLPVTRHWSRVSCWILLGWSQYCGWTVHDPNSEVPRIRLTPAGFEQAGRRVRNHRLWEEYLTSHTDISASHVDYSADLVEHYLSPDIIAQLESSLAARKGQDWLLVKHRSIHPLDET